MAVEAGSVAVPGYCCCDETEAGEKSLAVLAGVETNFLNVWMMVVEALEPPPQQKRAEASAVLRMIHQTPAQSGNAARNTAYNIGAAATKRLAARFKDEIVAVLDFMLEEVGELGLFVRSKKVGNVTAKKVQARLLVRRLIGTKDEIHAPA